MMCMCNRHTQFWKRIQAVLNEHMIQLLEADVLGSRCSTRVLPASAGHLLSHKRVLSQRSRDSEWSKLFK